MVFLGDLLKTIEITVILLFATWVFIPFFLCVLFLLEMFTWAPRGPTGFPRRNSPCVHDDLENHKNEEFPFILILKTDQHKRSQFTFLFSI